MGPSEDNSHAGQGSVVVDIGGDYGALVIHAPAEMVGVEIEIRPTGDTPFADGTLAAHEHHDHEHDEHDHGHHDHDHSHAGDGGLQQHHLLHVAVLRRPSPTDEPRFAAVFPSLHRGTYELYRRPAEPVALAVEIVGSEVADAYWPAGS